MANSYVSAIVLSQWLRERRTSRCFSMMDIAERMRKPTGKKLTTLVGVIGYFEKGWAELGYALTGKEPWKTYFEAYVSALGLASQEQTSLDTMVRDVTSEL